MNKRTRTALLESIEKWRQIERGEMADCGTANCSLCLEFHSANCCGCPVRDAGYQFCEGSPYIEWNDNQSERQFFEVTWVADTPELVRLARAERKFLESLLS